MDLTRLFLSPLLLVALAAPTALSAQAKGLVHTPDVDLAYDVLGTGTEHLPIIVVNGGPGLTHAYMVQNDIWTRLAQGRRVVFYDQRGVGRSTRLAPDASQTIDAQISDLEAVRLAVHADRFDLVGDSFGGLIALAYTLAHPDRVAHLIVSDGVPGFKARVHPMPDFFPDRDAETETQLKAMPEGKAADDLGMRAALRNCFYSPERAQQFLGHIHDLGFDAAVGYQLGAATQDVDLTPRLGNISVPTLILSGRFDVNVAPIVAWRMAKAIPRSKIHFFEHSGHLPFYEEPDAYVQQVAPFLAR